MDFKPDGGLRDIYVQDVLIKDWEKIIDFFNVNYNLKCRYTCCICIDASKPIVIHHIN